MADTEQDRQGGLASPRNARLYQGRVARVHADGDPLEYPGRPAPYDKQYRDAAGLQEIAAQLRTPRPLTLLHPDALISQGAKADVIGWVFGDMIDGEHAVPWILVTDPRGEKAIQDGIRELSLGYTRRALDARGRQRGIEVDHVALVPQARCGDSCALQMDCDTNEGCYCKIRAISYSRLYMAAPENDNPKAGGSSDHKDSAMDELQRQLMTALNDAAQAKARITQLEGELTSARTGLTTAQADAANARADLAQQRTLTDAANTRVTQAEAAATAAKAQAQADAVTQMDAAVKARVQLLTEANKVLGDKDAEGKPVDRTEMDDTSIRLAVITQIDGADFVEKLPEDSRKNPAFVRGVYSGALGRFDRAAASRAGAQQHLSQIRTDGAAAARRAAGAPEPKPAGSARQADAAPIQDAETRERLAMINRTQRQ